VDEELFEEKVEKNPDTSSSLSSSIPVFEWSEIVVGENNEDYSEKKKESFSSTNEEEDKVPSLRGHKNNNDDSSSSSSEEEKTSLRGKNDDSPSSEEKSLRAQDNINDTDDNADIPLSSSSLIATKPTSSSFLRGGKINNKNTKHKKKKLYDSVDMFFCWIGGVFVGIFFFMGYYHRRHRKRQNEIHNSYNKHQYKYLNSMLSHSTNNIVTINTTSIETDDGECIMSGNDNDDIPVRAALTT